MKQSYEPTVLVGEEVRVNATEFDGRIVLETEFVEYDGLLSQLDLKQSGIQCDDYLAMDEFDEEEHDFRSVRIYHLATGEKIILKPGDEVRAEIQSISVARELTKDGRRKVHIVLKNAHHVYHWVRDKQESSLVLQLWCGRRKARERVIPLQCRNTGAIRKDGRVYPVRSAVLLPKGRIFSVSVDHTSGMSSGDYILRERLKGRTPRQIHADFLPEPPPYDRSIPTRQRMRQPMTMS